MRGHTYTFETGSRPNADVASEIEAVIERLDGDGSVDDCLDNVYWKPHRSTYAGAWTDVAPPGAIETPQVAKTSTEDHSYSGEARLYRRFDGEYVAVDVFSTLPDSFWAVADYLAANYDLVPALQDGHYRLFSADRRLPGCRESPPADPESDREAALFAVLRDERDALSHEEAVALLDVDEYYHLLATKFPDAVADADAAVDRRILEWLRSDDSALQSRAVRWIGAVASRPTDRSSETAPAGKDRTSHTPDAVPSIDGIDTFERFVRALPSVDVTTQRLVARTLWEPWTLSAETFPEPDHVSALAGLLDAELPEIRVAALHGTSRVLGELVVAAETDDEGPASLGELAPAIEAFYDAYVAALSDEHPVVRARAADLMVSVLGGELRDDVTVVTERLLTELPLETRADVVFGLARSNEEREAIATRIADQNVENLFERAFDESPEAVEALVFYGYEERGPAWRGAREALATLAAENPTVVADRVDAPIAAVRDGTAIAADLELLTELVPIAADEIASVGDELAALLDGPTAVRAEAAWTIHSLRADRPTAVSVDRETIVEVIANVRDENDWLVPERLRRLAVAAPDRAVDVLATLAGDVSRSTGEGVGTRRFADAVQAVSKADPSVVARAAPDVCDALSTFNSYDYGAFVGVARAAVARPAAFTGTVDALVDALATDDELTREALATTLIAVGEHDRTALPSTVGPLCERAEDAYDPDELERYAERDGLSFSRDAAGPLAAIDETTFDATT
ncbi:hypothetical protein [Halovivax cerinus]|uniref:Uncharacterized protein n=1 Tax=Halovivax cerinus TaxID=1487865 RepID=A0ABD5NKB4_9EURY|nr:hypothetical protein [Halovivax cerinus]